MDYRDIPAHFEKSFDTFISIEMLEHVGAKVCSPYISGASIYLTVLSIMSALSHIFQTRRLRPETTERNRCGQCKYVPRVTLLGIPVSTPRRHVTLQVLTLLATQLGPKIL